MEIVNVDPGQKCYICQCEIMDPMAYRREEHEGMVQVICRHCERRVSNERGDTNE